MVCCLCSVWYAACALYGMLPVLCMVCCRCCGCLALSLRWCASRSETAALAATIRPHRLFTQRRGRGFAATPLSEKQLLQRITSNDPKCTALQCTSPPAISCCHLTATPLCSHTATQPCSLCALHFAPCHHCVCSHSLPHSLVLHSLTILKLKGYYGDTKYGMTMLLEALRDSNDHVLPCHTRCRAA